MVSVSYIIMLVIIMLMTCFIPPSVVVGCNRGVKDVMLNLEAITSLAASKCSDISMFPGI